MKETLLQILSTTFSIYSALRNHCTACPLPVAARKDDLIILGNGPSLANSLERATNFLQSKPSLCVNSFVDSQYFEILKPNYYLFLDPDYWRDESLPSLKESRDRVFASLVQKTTWNLTLFFPAHSARCANWAKKFAGNTKLRISYFNSTPLSGFKSIIFKLYRKNFGMPLAQNVLVAAIFTAINMGYKRVFLIGADHSWHKDLVLNESNIVCYRDKHFYDESDAKLIPWEKGDNSGATWKMHEILAALARMFEGYQVLEDYATFRGAQVFNASAETHIDAFPRCNLPLNSTASQSQTCLHYSFSKPQFHNTPVTG